MTIAAVGVAIGTIAGRISKTEKVKEAKSLKQATNPKNQPNTGEVKAEGDKDLDDLDNCFI